jgi:hypothetical protein
LQRRRLKAGRSLKAGDSQFSDRSQMALVLHGLPERSAVRRWPRSRVPRGTNLASPLLSDPDRKDGCPAWLSPGRRPVFLPGFTPGRTFSRQPATTSFQGAVPEGTAQLSIRTTDRERPNRSESHGPESPCIPIPEGRGFTATFGKRGEPAPCERCGIEISPAESYAPGRLICGDCFEEGGAL